MSEHKVHDDHNHVHGDGCGHKAIEHNDHVDYLHDGHLHHMHEGHVDEHSLDSSGSTACTSGHSCSDHDTGHKHGQGCGHEAIPHNGHVDYLVGSHLHSAHEGHCDNHGAVKVK
jgi:hypothetical protein